MDNLQSGADDAYLWRLSHSLRAQVNKPVKRVLNPIYDSGQDIKNSTVISPYKINAEQPSTGFANTGLQRPRMHQQRDQQQQGTVPKGSGYSPGNVIRASGRPEADGVERKGTLRYTGLASRQWLEQEVANDVDDLARNVDTFATQREAKLFEAKEAALKAEIEEMKKAKAEQEEKMRKLQTLIPNENGEFRALKQELDELEADCDYYYKKYQAEVGQRAAIEKQLQEATARLRTLEAQLLQHQQAAAAAAGQAPSGADVAITIGPEQAPGGHQGPPFVTPEAVLAAAKFLGDNGLPPGGSSRKWPDKAVIATRLALVALWMLTLAGSVLLTYFLTLKYA